MDDVGDLDQRGLSGVVVAVAIGGDGNRTGGEELGTPCVGNLFQRSGPQEERNKGAEDERIWWNIAQQACTPSPSIHRRRVCFPPH